MSLVFKSLHFFLNLSVFSICGALAIGCSALTTGTPTKSIGSGAGAQDLTWQEGAGVSVTHSTVHLVWSPLQSTAVVNQEIQLHDGDQCQTPRGAPITIGANVGTYAYTPGSVGTLTLTYKISTISATGKRDTSNCSQVLTIDLTPPSAPTVSATSPVSPANNNAPLITGSAEAGSIVKVYTNSNCTSAVAGTGTATGGVFSIAVSQSDNSTQTYYATATDAAGNASACSSTSVSFVEDSVFPNNAGSLSWSIASPSTGPTLVASWTKSNEAVATFLNQKIQMYQSATCQVGAEVGSLTTLTNADQTFNFTGVNGNTYTYKITTTDSASNASVSGCSSAMVIQAPTWSPLTNAYGSVSADTNSAPVVFTLTNNGSTAATGCSAPVLAGANASEFSISVDNCGTNDLSASGGTCTVSVRASPTSAGAKTATLSRACTFGGTMTTTANGLTTTGVVTTFTWSPTSQSFGSVILNENSVATTFTFTNTGSVTPGICDAPTLAGTNAGDFNIYLDNCGTTLQAPAGTCTVLVRANPTSASGTRAATLRRYCHGHGTKDSTADGLTATGSFGIQWSRTTQSFGTASVAYKSAKRTFYFQNPSGTSATGCGAPGLSNVADFEITNDGCGTSNLAGRSQCAVEVRFRPANTGGLLSTLSRTCTTGGSASVNLSGVAIAETPSSIAKTATLSEHTCIVMSNGTIRCWGYNSSGQLGNGGSAEALTGTQVTGISTATQVAMGATHTCALLSDQTMKCWGANGNGQLGDGTTTASMTPVTVTGLTGVTAIALGSLSTCALLSDQTVKCWGYNAFGTVGDNSNTDRSSPTAVTGLTGVTAIAISGWTACGLLSDQTVKCWGNNTAGAVGDNSTTDRWTPTAVSGLTNVLAISGGGNHVCAMVFGDTVKCWGSNTYGQVGDGSTTNRLTPVTVTGLTNVSSIAMGYHSSCAALADRTVQCWGRNVMGLIGDGTVTQRTTPVTVTGLSNVAKVVVGKTHACSIKADHSVQCWGGNYASQLGSSLELANNTAVPQPLSSITTATAIAVGATHSCALLSGGTIQCWGNNSAGNMGIGTSSITSDSLNPTPVTVSGITTATAIAVGNNFTCALLANQTVKCWGQNSSGQLGDTTTTQRSTPVAVSGVAGVIAIAAGTSHACAILSDNTGKCWGANAYGQLGNGSTTASSTAVVVTGLAGATAVTAGDRFTCAKVASGALKCWGDNTYGQLGDNTTVAKTTPVSVSNITGVNTFAAGNNTVCAALAVNQRVMCWGLGAFGRLGDNTTNSYTVPTYMSSLNGVTDVSNGNASGLRLLADQTVRVTGMNSNGQHGLGVVIGSTIHTTIPKLIYGLPAVQAVGYGPTADHQCVVDTNGTPWCWGKGYDHANGNGPSLTAVGVSGFDL